MAEALINEPDADDPVDAPLPVDIDEAEALNTESLSPGQLARRRYRRHRPAMIATIVLLIIAIIVIFAPWTAPFGENEPFGPEEINRGPRGTFWFGTDSIGRDLLSRTIYGGRVSLFVGIASAISAGVIGTLLGAFAGFRGGRIDNLLMRFTDIAIGLPLLVVLIIMRQLPENQEWAATVLGEPGSIRLMVTIISLVTWTVLARLVRGQVLSLKEKEYVEAAKAIGASDAHIILRHLVPNTIGTIVVAMTFIVATAIGLEATLSFFGLGISGEAGAASWGTLLSASQSYISAGFWWLVVFPAIALLVTIMCINFIGDGLRDALDPRQGQEK